MITKLWGGRFKRRTDRQFARFSSSLKWDWRLLPYDLKIDAAHTRALAKCGVLSRPERTKFLRALSALERRLRRGTLQIHESFEDVHSLIQAELSKALGPLADKLHTARSRNDLVSQSARLYCKHHGQRILLLIQELQKAIVEAASRHEKVFVPGMTHLQNAQVISQAHIFLAYAEMLDRAKIRFLGGMPFFDVCVLGSGALAGVTFKLDQKRIARELGLKSIANNSYDVSGDRDFAVNFLSCMLFLNLQMSRVAEDLMIGQTRGFTLLRIDEALCTGSSMMPQKKNADFLELARGAVGVFAGNFWGLVTTVKALPTSYNRDLQWDKKYLFDSTETCVELLGLWIKLFKTIRVDEARAKELLADESLYATDLADTLVRKGVPFKQAHEQVGRIVSFAEKNKLQISKIGLDLLKKFAPKIDGSVYDLFDAKHSVRLKKTIGSTHPDQIRKQINRWKKILKI